MALSLASPFRPRHPHPHKSQRGFVIQPRVAEPQRRSPGNLALFSESKPTVLSAHRVHQQRLLAPPPPAATSSPLALIASLMTQLTWHRNDRENLFGGSDQRDTMTGSGHGSTADRTAPTVAPPAPHHSRWCCCVHIRAFVKPKPSRCPTRS